MSVLATSNLSPGLEVVSDVRNLNGALLIEAGTLLNNHHITLLKMWGIETVTVSDPQLEPNSNTAPAPPSNARQLAESWIHERFRHVTEEHRAIPMIKELAIRRLAMRIEKGDHPKHPRHPIPCKK